MCMTGKARDKGNRYERDLVKAFNDLPNIYAERTWGSNGATKGLSTKVDLIIDHYDETYYAQAKNYKLANLPTGFKTFCYAILEDVSMGFVKEEGSKVDKSFVIMKLETLLKIIKASDDSTTNLEAR